MNIRRIAVILFFSSQLATIALATSPATPRPYFHVPGVAAPYCLEITPTIGEAIAQVRCLRFNFDGRKKVLWVVKGEYSPPGNIFLTGDGISMARLRQPTKKMPPEVLAEWKYIEFFRDGKLASSVSLGDLLDVSKLQESAVSTILYEITNRYLDVDGVEVFAGDDGFVKRLELAQEKMLDRSDCLLIIHTSQWRSVYFRLSDGKRILSRVTVRKE